MLCVLTDIYCSAHIWTSASVVGVRPNYRSRDVSEAELNMATVGGHLGDIDSS